MIITHNIVNAFGIVVVYIDGLVQERRNSIANVLE